MIFILDGDIQKYTRTVYSMWDLLGDIGGLFDILKQLAWPILYLGSLIFGSGLEGLMIESLFKV